MTFSTSGDYTLRSGETLRGHFIMTSGETTLEEGSRVTGDLVMTSGTLNVEGQVDGDILFSSAERVKLGPAAVVEGDIKGTSGRVELAEGARVDGQISDHQTFSFGAGFFARMLALFCLLPLAAIVVLFAGLGRIRGRATTQQQPVAEPQDAVQKLMKMRELMQAGLISEKEYEMKKAEILADV
jgi:cytoskeletal protein CcmA (bactofilin family)